jgi:arylsulfatase A-like enzyme
MFSLALLLTACAPEIPIANTFEANAKRVGSGHARNVLFLTVDTLRRDALGVYGDHGDTPFLDRFAVGSLVLEDHRSCATWTLASMTCLMAGQDLIELGYEPTSGYGQWTGIPKDFAGLPVWLGDAGLETALIGTNPFLSTRTPLGNGFDTVRMPAEEGLGSRAGSVVDSALAWLQEREDPSAPGYLHLHFLDPHHPYEAPDGWLEALSELPTLPEGVNSPVDPSDVERQMRDYSDSGREAVLAHLRAQYAAEVRYLDSEIERLILAPEARDFLKEAVIVLVSDHGEAFYEHQDLLHGRSVYGEITGIPAIISAPDLGAGIWQDPTSHRNLAASILTLLGLESPAGSAPDLWDQDPDGQRFIVRSGGGDGAQVAVVQDHHSLIYTWDGTLELFDEWRDEAQSADLLDRRPGIAASLWESLSPVVFDIDDWETSDDDAILPSDL